jgi:hypothetical protein
VYKYLSSKVKARWLVTPESGDNGVCHTTRSLGRGFSAPTGASFSTLAAFFLHPNMVRIAPIKRTNFVAVMAMHFRHIKKLVFHKNLFGRFACDYATVAENGR